MACPKGRIDIGRDQFKMLKMMRLDCVAEQILARMEMANGCGLHLAELETMFPQVPRNNDRQRKTMLMIVQDLVNADAAVQNKFDVSVLNL